MTQLSSSADELLSTIGRDPADDVYVVHPSELDAMRGWHVAARVVVDYTADQVPTLPMLAQVVLLRRRLRAAGGDVVIAANPQTAALLRSSGLHWAVPCCYDLSSAVEALR